MWSWPFRLCIFLKVAYDTISSAYERSSETSLPVDMSETFFADNCHDNDELLSAFRTNRTRVADFIYDEFSGVLSV